MFEPFGDIAITDIVDILFVAVMLYTAIAWAQKTRAAFVVRGMFILAVVYIVARQLELQLTAWIFQGFFAIFLIIIVVIFQEELRQIFERIAIWSLSSKRLPLRPGAVDIVVRTLADFTRDRIGALVVVRGNDPLERHVMGGIELDGKISGPLLKSIFDPHSPGHDGAVIVEQGRVTRFAAHLPLSEDFQQLVGMGTRHSAALGLTELTDALCIAVSEERGKISVAQEGKIRQINNLQELGALIQEFLQKKYPSPKGKKISIQLVRENWVTKVSALALAITFWYVFVPGSKTVEVAYKIPVQVENLAPDLQLDQIQPPQVTATFVGPRRSFYLFDPTTLKVTVDVSLAEMGRRTFRISEQNVRYPKDLILQDLNPSTLKISVKKAPRAGENDRG